MFEPEEFQEQDRDLLWSRVLDRDAKADGTFVYAVSTTGIYCRPSCPAKRPSRENVHFFYSSDGARSAGFRACRRCRPDEASRVEQVVAQAMAMIERRDGTPRLAELAQHVGLTPRHLHRTFRQSTGLTPLQYARAVKGERLSSALRMGQPVGRALYEAGFDSSHALYDQANRLLGMTPGRYRDGGAGESIRYAFTDTELGHMMVAATRRGVCSVRFGDESSTLKELGEEFPEAQRVLDPIAMQSVLEAVQNRVRGLADARPLALDIEATDFQRRVWQALLDVPMGETRSYKEIAETIGAPTAVRAVARACAANPVALIVPCHRVLRASGALSGYRWGVKRKAALLARERARQYRGTGAPKAPARVTYIDTASNERDSE